MSETAEDERTVTFQTADGLLLEGTLKNVGTQAVVLCHGLADQRDALVYPQLAVALAEHGFSSLRFDFRGNGKSGGSFKFANFKEEVEDVRAAVQFLSELGKKAIAIVGHSKGGSTVLLYTARYGDVPKVVSVAPRFHQQEGITKRFGEDIFERLQKDGQVDIKWTRRGAPFLWTLTREDMDERLALDMRACSEAIKQSAVALIHGTQDATIPYQDAAAFHKNIPSSQIHIMEGACHNFQNPEHAKRLVRVITDYIISGELAPGDVVPD